MTRLQRPLLRTDLDAMRRIPIRLLVASGAGQTPYVRLADVASIEVAPGPNQISRENAKWRVVVTANVHGRDIGSFVAKRRRGSMERSACRAVTGSRGAAPSNSCSRRRGGSRSWYPSRCCSSSCCSSPCSATSRTDCSSSPACRSPHRRHPGAVAARHSAFHFGRRRLHRPVRRGVLNGLVMIAFIRALREQGRSLDDAIREGAMSRLRPVLMTALVASLGFVPMAIATGTGAEVQRPLATVVIGGILSSTLLTCSCCRCCIGCFTARATMSPARVIAGPATR